MKWTSASKIHTKDAQNVEDFSSKKTKKLENCHEIKSKWLENISV